MGAGIIGHEGFSNKPIHFGKPLIDVTDDGFKQDTATHLTDTHAVTLKAKLLRKSNSLATTIEEEFTGAMFKSACRHSRYLSVVYIKVKDCEWL